MNAKKKTRGFTLVELLLAMVVIAILAGMIVSVSNSVREGSKKAMAKADVRRLELALQAYYNEYGRWPDTAGVSRADFFTMLNGNQDPATGAKAVAGSYAENWNPRRLRFIQINRKQWKTGDDEFVDPWGHGYSLLIDNGQEAIGNSAVTSLWVDQDGGVDSPSDGVLRSRYDPAAYDLKRSIAVYSFGPNEQDEAAPKAGSDDITSWY